MIRQNDQMAAGRLDGGQPMADVRQSTPEEQLEHMRAHLVMSEAHPPSETHPVTFRQVTVAQTTSGLMLYGLSFGGYLYRASNPAGQLALKDLDWVKLPEASEPNADYEEQLEAWNTEVSKLKAIIAAKEAELGDAAAVNDTAATLAGAETVSDDEVAAAELSGDKVASEAEVAHNGDQPEVAHNGDQPVVQQEAPAETEPDNPPSPKRGKGKGKNKGGSKPTAATTEDAAPPASTDDAPVDAPDGEPKPAP